MTTSPSEIGAIAEREVACALARAGWEVFVPFFWAHSRVDLVALRGPASYRVQVKHAVVRDDVVVFRPFSNTANRPRCYDGEVDAFGVYAAAIERVYLIPVDETAPRNCSLRLSPPRNGQRARVRYAADYEVTPRC